MKKRRKNIKKYQSGGGAGYGTINPNYVFRKDQQPLAPGGNHAQLNTVVRNNPFAAPGDSISKQDVLMMQQQLAYQMQLEMLRREELMRLQMEKELIWEKGRLRLQQELMNNPKLRNEYNNSMNKKQDAVLDSMERAGVNNRIPEERLRKRLFKKLGRRTKKRRGGSTGARGRNGIL